MLTFCRDAHRVYFCRKATKTGNDSSEAAANTSLAGRECIYRQSDPIVVYGAGWTQTQDTALQGTKTLLFGRAGKSTKSLKLEEKTKDQVKLDTKLLPGEGFEARQWTASPGARRHTSCTEKNNDN